MFVKMAEEVTLNSLKQLVTGIMASTSSMLSKCREADERIQTLDAANVRMANQLGTISDSVEQINNRVLVMEDSVKTSKLLLSSIKERKEAHENLESQLVDIRRSLDKQDNRFETYRKTHDFHETGAVFAKF